MVAGVYGMNFDFMPELHWRFGYPLVLMMTAALVLLLYRNVPPQPAGCSRSRTVEPRRPRAGRSRPSLDG